MKPGMRLGEALATCPSLILVDRDPASVEREWEDVLRRLEDAGFAVDPVEQGAVVFRDEGSRAALRGRAAGARARARCSRLDVGSARRRGGKAPHRTRGRECRACGADPHGGGEGGRGVPRPAAALAAPHDAESLRGARGPWFSLHSGSWRSSPAELSRSGWGWRGGTRGGSHTAAARRACVGAGPPRRPRRDARLPRSDSEQLTLRRALGSLLERLLASRTGRAAVSNSRWSPGSSMAARGDGSRRFVTRPPRSAACAPRSGRSCREASRRLSSSFASRRSHSRSTRGSSSRSSSPAGEEAVVRLREGLRQVKASTGTGWCAVVEVAPWSRVPEARALVVPRDV